MPGPRSVLEMPIKFMDYHEAFMEYHKAFYGILKHFNIKKLLWNTTKLRGILRSLFGMSISFMEYQEAFKEYQTAFMGYQDVLRVSFFGSLA